MKKSSNTTRNRAPKSDSQLPEKTHKTQSSCAAKLKAKKEETSATKIQKAWFIYLDKTLFKLLKHIVCAAEYCVAHELLKEIIPREAELLKDPSMKCKVRFRFSGEMFPPCIVFKIFLKNGHGYKYFSGKDLLKPSSKGETDAYKIMGGRKFNQQIMDDEHYFQKYKVTGRMEVITVQDYMQYCSFMDKAPVSSGGKNNNWRKLSLKSIPKTMMMYDILHYAESGVISNRLRKEMKYLSQKPRTEAMRQHQLHLVSKVRCPPITNIYPFYQPWEQGKSKHLGRRSKQAQKKVEKMKKAYKAPKDEKVSPKEPQIDWSRVKRKVVFRTSSLEIMAIEELIDSGLENETKDLFTWYQDLCVKYSSLF